MAARFYQSGGAIEGAGRIFGGPTLAIDDVQQLDALIALVQDVGSDGLTRVASWFSRFDEWLAWVAENGERLELHASERSVRLGSRHPDNLADIERFETSLVCAREMATRLTTNDWQQVRFVVSVSTTTGLSYEGDSSGVFLRDGSIEPILAVAAVGAAAPFVATLGGWAVGVIRIGLLPTIQAEELVKSLRTAARPDAQLEDLSVLDPLEVRKKKGVLIFLHGVLSTDVGTFDGFIKRWQSAPLDDDASVLKLRMRWLEKHPERGSDVYYLTADACRDAVAGAAADYLAVGWPHDTLTGIQRNAGDLAELLIEKCAPDGPPIVFVCHSRGGLVARSAAAWLFQHHPKWKETLKLCVTFGTPHLGAELAEHPLRFLATYMVLFAGTRNVLTLPRLLSVYERRSGFPGVEDMRPDSDFLQQLRDNERSSAPRDRVRALDILAVGGVCRNALWPQRLVTTGLFRTTLHDLVVRLTSTIPATFPSRYQTSCGHSEYFVEGQTSEPHYTAIIERIRDMFGFNDNVVDKLVPRR